MEDIRGGDERAGVKTLIRKRRRMSDYTWKARIEEPRRSYQTRR
jgi:hypothetical protein